MKKLMTEEKSLSLSHPNPEIYYQASNKRRWELCYTGKDRRIYLTDYERNMFLQAVLNGVEVVQVGDLTLTKFFQFLVPVRSGKSETVLPHVSEISEEQRLKNLERLKELKKKWHGK